MIEPLIHSVREFFAAIFKIYFGDYNKLQSVNSFRNFVLDVLNVISKFLFLYLAFTIAEQLKFIGEYLLSDLCKYNSFIDGLSFDWKVFLSLFLTYLAYHFCRVGLKRIKDSIHLESFFMENHKLQIDKIYTQTLSLGNKISKNHNISFSFFSSWANEQNDYVKFIELLQKTTHIRPQDLTSIAEIAKKSTYGHFMCVIAYLDFFKNENEFKEMVNYFSKYEIVASDRKSIVQRIFTIPGVDKSDPNDAFYKSFWIEEDKKINNYYLFCYLVLNDICSCDSYLLIYDKDKKNLLANRFLVDVDYVLAFKNQDYKSGDDVELYFAYPEEGELNRTLKINDAYFIRMFEIDFQKRMELDPSDETPTTLYKFNVGNRDKILQMLHINTNNKDNKNKLNEKLNSMKVLLSRNDLFNQAVINKIEDWKIK